MVKPDEAKSIALSFEGAGEQPHFNRTAFTVKKKIFATLSVEDNTLNLKIFSAAANHILPAKKRCDLRNTKWME